MKMNRKTIKSGRTTGLLTGTIWSVLTAVATAQPPAHSQDHGQDQETSSLPCADYLAYPLPEQPCSPPVSKRITPACQYFRGLKVAIEDQATYLVPEYAAQAADASQAPVEVQGSGCQRVLERLYDRLVGYTCPERTQESQQEFVQALQREGCFGITAEDKRVYTLGYVPGRGLVAEVVDPRMEREAPAFDEKREVAEYRRQLVEMLAPELARSNPSTPRDKTGVLASPNLAFSYSKLAGGRELP